jgi:hypothetical protein
VLPYEKIRDSDTGAFPGGRTAARNASNAAGVVVSLAVALARSRVARTPTEPNSAVEAMALLLVLAIQTPVSFSKPLHFQLAQPSRHVSLQVRKLVVGLDHDGGWVGNA